MASETPKRGATTTPTVAAGETPIKRMALKATENGPPTPASTRRRVARDVKKNLADENDDLREDSGSDEDEETSDKDTDSDEDDDLMAGKKQVRQFIVSPRKTAAATAAATKAAVPASPVSQDKKGKKTHAAKWSNKGK